MQEALQILIDLGIEKKVRGFEELQRFKDRPGRLSSFCRLLSEVTRVSRHATATNEVLIAPISLASDVLQQAGVSPPRHAGALEQLILTAATGDSRKIKELLAIFFGVTGDAIAFDVQSATAKGLLHNKALQLGILQHAAVLFCAMACGKLFCDAEKLHVHPPEEKPSTAARETEEMDGANVGTDLLSGLLNKLKSVMSPQRKLGAHNDDKSAKRRAAFAEKAVTAALKYMPLPSGGDKQLQTSLIRIARLLAEGHEKRLPFSLADVRNRISMLRQTEVPVYQRQEVAVSVLHEIVPMVVSALKLNMDPHRAVNISSQIVTVILGGDPNACRALAEEIGVPGDISERVASVISLSSLRGTRDTDDVRVAVNAFISTL